MFAKFARGFTMKYLHDDKRVKKYLRYNRPGYSLIFHHELVLNYANTCDAMRHLYNDKETLNLTLNLVFEA